jgi:hypothetical protein
VSPREMGEFISAFKVDVLVFYVIIALKTSTEFLTIYHSYIIMYKNCILFKFQDCSMKQNGE